MLQLWTGVGQKDRNLRIFYYCFFSSSLWKINSTYSSPRFKAFLFLRSYRQTCPNRKRDCLWVNEPNKLGHIFLYETPTNFLLSYFYSIFIREVIIPTFLTFFFFSFLYGGLLFLFSPLFPAINFYSTKNLFSHQAVEIFSIKSNENDNFLGDLVGIWSSKFHYWKFISRINFKYRLSFSILEVITMEIGLGYALNILYTSGYLVKPLA